MKISFPTKLVSLVFFFLLVSVSASTGLVLSFYKTDKVDTLFRSQSADTMKVSSYLSSLMLFAHGVALERTSESKEVILLFDNPCAKNPEFKISHYYEAQFNELELDARDWVYSLEVFKICKEIQVAPKPAKGAVNFKILASGPSLMVPYVTIFLTSFEGSRLAVISMDQLSSDISNTIFLVNKKGEILWAADGNEYLKSAIADTQVTYKELKEIAVKLVGEKIAKTFLVGKFGLLSYAPVNAEWSLFSLSHSPTILQPVYYAIQQSLFLTLGLLFFCMFLAKIGANVVVRPLDALRVSAQLLAEGNFSNHIVVKGNDEFATVQIAFNRMIDEIKKLIDDIKEKAGMEQELDLAQKVQSTLMPPTQVTTRVGLLHSVVKNATQCGGDWWNFIETVGPDGKVRLILMIGDATGHGVPSALITAVIRGAVSVISNFVSVDSSWTDNPGRINYYLNRCILEASKGEISMTFFIAVVNPIDGLIRCSNAGHNNPYLIKTESGSAKPKITLLGTASIPLGNEKDTKYEEFDEHPWGPGSKLFLYTDGLIDCMDGDKVLFDRKSLRKILNIHGGLAGPSLLQKIMTERMAKSGDLLQADDITAVVCDYRGVTA